MSCWLTSVSGPLSAPGQEKLTNSWHRLWTTKQHTKGKQESITVIHEAKIVSYFMWNGCCMFTKCAHSLNLQFLRKKWQKHKQACTQSMISLFCFMQAVRQQCRHRGRSSASKAVSQRKCACRLSSINPKVSLATRSNADTQTNAYRQTNARVHPHSHPHTKK